MNYETIRTFLNTPISELTRDETAIENAKENLKTYECFNSLLKDKVELFKQCEKTILLELLNNLQLYETIDRSFILGYKAGIKSLLKGFDKYQEAFNYLHKEGGYLNGTTRTD